LKWSDLRYVFWQREARRQKGLPLAPVPEVCVLDPDGDIVRHLRATERAARHTGWACYHTELYAFREAGREFGIVPCAVGASYAVLVAEELFASGCKFLISITSSGQIRPLGDPPYFIVIDRALRDEGTSYHYLPPSEFTHANPTIVEFARKSLVEAHAHAEVGATWTTDAPFRETEEAIRAAFEGGILAVEMEAAALYAFCGSPTAGRTVPGTRHESDGAHRRRLRERRRGRRGGIPACTLADREKLGFEAAIGSADHSHFARM
jgi:nucleoside phosphorylase